MGSPSVLCQDSFPFSRLFSVQIRATRDLNTVTSSITVRLSQLISNKMHEAASWVGCRLMPDPDICGPESRGTRSEERSGEWGRWQQGGLTLTQTLETWHSWRHCVASSKCVAPTKATPVTMQPDFPINFIIPLSHQIDQYKARSSLLDNWPRARRNETPSGHLQLRTF